MKNTSHAKTKTATQRDNQRGRVIRAGFSLTLISRHFNLWEQQAYLKTILSDDWVRQLVGETPIKTKDLDQKKILYAVARAKHPRHDEAFCRTYLRLIARFMGSEARKTLEKAYEFHGVKYQ